MSARPGTFSFTGGAGSRRPSRLVTQPFRHPGGSGSTVNDRDREAFERLVATRSQALLRSAYLMTGDAQSAEDLLQTALAKMIPRWGRLRDPEAAEAYLRRVMTSTYLKWWRRRWRSEVPTETLPD